MEKKQWVQHISGQGEKWLVVYGGDPIDWMVLCKATDGERNRALPKSEYRLCAPPEVWKDVSGECEVPGDDRQCTITHKGTVFNTQNGYRFRKVEVNLIGPNYQYGCKKAWAFIVEQKVSQ